MNQEILEAIETIGFERLFKDLLAYSEFHLSGIDKNKIKGFSPKDVPAEVFEIALKKAKWDKLKFPDIKSYLLHLTKNACRRLWRNKEYKSLTSSETIFEELMNENTDNFHSDIEAQELCDQMQSIIQSNKKDSLDLISDVFDVMLDGYQNIEIAELLSISVDDVVNYKKRIRRYLINFK